MIEAKESARISEDGLEILSTRGRALINPQPLFDLFEETIPLEGRRYLKTPFSLTVVMCELSFAGGLLLPKWSDYDSTISKTLHTRRLSGVHIIIDSNYVSEESGLITTTPKDLHDNFIFMHEWRHMMDLIRINRYSASEDICDEFALGQVRKIEGGDSFPILTII